LSIKGAFVLLARLSVVLYARGPPAADNASRHDFSFTFFEQHQSRITFTHILAVLPPWLSASPVAVRDLVE